MKRTTQRAKKRLSESVGDRPSTNLQIERLLQRHDRAAQTRILDALEAVKNAGPAGLSVQEWADAVRQLHPDAPMKDLLKTVAHEFGCCVRRVGEKRYGWDESDREINDAPPELQAMVGNQIAFTHAAMRLMREMGEFSLDDLAARLRRMTNLPPEQVAMMAEHIVGQFVGGVIERVGPNRYRVAVERPKSTDDHIANLKDLARRAGEQPG